MYLCLIYLFFVYCAECFNPDEIINSNKYQPVIPRLKWLHDDSFLITFNDSQIIQRNYPFHDINLTEFFHLPKGCNYLKAELSLNKLWLSFPCNAVKKFRHSFSADYIFLHHLKQGEYILSTPPYIANLPLQYLYWQGPNESYIYAKDNNIFYAKDVNERPHQITFDGIDEKIFNGIADWVYEEEVFRDSGSVVGNINGIYILYTRIDDTQVNTIEVPRLDAINYTYPLKTTIKYPRAGTPNPLIAVFAHKVGNCNHKYDECKRVELKLPSPFNEKDSIVSFFKLTDSDHAIVGWVNRKQDFLLITRHNLNLASYGILDGEIIFSNETSGWFDDKIFSNVKFSPIDGRMFFTFPTIGEQDDSFLHIVGLDYIHPTGLDAYTNGNWEVSDIKCVSDKYIYYISNEESFYSRQLYRTDLSTKHTKCVSCHLTTVEYHAVDAAMSSTCNIAYIVFLGPNVPSCWLFNLDPSSNTTSQPILVEENKELAKRMEIEKPFKTRYRVLNFEPSIYVKVKYPLTMNTWYRQSNAPFLIDIYGGPGFNAVEDNFQMAFEDYFSYKYKTIVIKADVRGSHGYGQKYKFSVKNQLGLFEAEDLAKLINLKKRAQKNSKFCVKGWSYGGFLALTLLKHYPKLIDCAIAIAPVTDWRYYDSVYTERYMGYPFPTDNLQGYDASSLLNDMSPFANKSIFIAQGTADENVNFQNTEKLVFNMIEAGINVEYMVFPYKDHSIMGVNTRKILYEKIEAFLAKNLNKK